VRYYDESYAHCIKRPVCCVNPGEGIGEADDEYMAADEESGSAVVYQSGHQN